MNILITGANGFIGKYLCDFFEKKKHSIYRIVRQKQDAELHTYECDLTDKKSTKKLKTDLSNEKIDIVIHLASKLAQPNQNKEEQVQVLLDNIEITNNMAELIKELKPRKLINFSSMAVYPNIDGVFSEESQIKMSDNTDCMYGLSKFCSENIFDFVLKNDPVLVSHLRIAQVYGDGMSADRIIPVMQKELKENNTITVFGNGERESSFISVDKLIEVTNGFIVKNVHGTYNIGNESFSYLELAQNIIEKFGNKSSRIIIKKEGPKPRFKINTEKLSEIIDIGG